MRRPSSPSSKIQDHFPVRDLFYGWLAATLLSGLPSTLYALSTGNDVWEATRAAGAMLLPSNASLSKLVLAAAVVHSTVSLFWAIVLAHSLPRRRIGLSAIAASVAIALLDLLVIAPMYFPEVAALDFWPQLADHIMWGAAFGLTLELLHKRRPPRSSADSS
jgi:hypothetical protein